MPCPHRPLAVWLAVHDADLERYLRLALAGAGEPPMRVSAQAAGADLAMARAARSSGAGAALLAALRQAEATRTLPVLFVGGSDEARAELRALGDARIAFLAEPFNAAQVRAAVTALVDRAAAEYGEPPTA